MKQLRTEERDKKFAGLWYCNTCGHYVANLVGIMGDHTEHDLTVLPQAKTKDCCHYGTKESKK